MSESVGLPPIPLMTPKRARDIARGHMWLEEQYRLADMTDAADEANRAARLWLAYSQTLAAAGAGPAEKA